MNVKLKTKFARADAISVARELCAQLKPATERLIVAGSLRRRKLEVGDVEILYIPRTADVRDGLFDIARLNLADQVLDRLLSENILEKRLNTAGNAIWGPSNKLARHVQSRIPVDLFTANQSNWFNYLVCRTGSEANNVRISMAAQHKGWEWRPYREGFTDQEGRPVRVESEEDVFRLVSLPWLQPWER